MSGETEVSRRPSATGGAGSPAIEISGVTVRFDSLTALDGASMTVQPGEFVSLLGPSGCGKTTLLKVIGGLIEPADGSVRVMGASVQEARRDRAFGFVFQGATLLPWRNAKANAKLLAEICGKVDDERIAALMAEVGLTDFHDSKPSQLSGGMQQRLSIVRALAFDPQVLLMDEPFAALDALTRDRLGEVLLRVWNSTKPIVFVTHSIEEAAFLSDRVIVMSARPGRIMAEVRIDLPRPRSHELKEQPEFFDVIRHLRHLVDAAQGAAGAH